MGMLANYMEADAELINKMKGMASEEIFELVEELEDEGELFVAGIDKMWDSLHFLLTGTSIGSKKPEGLKSIAVFGETSFDLEDVYIAYIYPNRIEDVANAINDVNIDILLKNFNPEKFAREEVYPVIWSDLDEEEIEEIKEELLYSFNELKGFYNKMLSKKRGAIVSIY